MLLFRVGHKAQMGSFVMATAVNITTTEIHTHVGVRICPAFFSVIFCGNSPKHSARESAILFFFHFELHAQSRQIYLYNFFRKICICKYIDILSESQLAFLLLHNDIGSLGILPTRNVYMNMFSSNSKNHNKNEEEKWTQEKSISQ